MLGPQNTPHTIERFATLSQYGPSSQLAGRDDGIYHVTYMALLFGNVTPEFFDMILVTFEFIFVDLSI